MKSPHSFIVRPKDKRYASKNIGGVAFETATSIEDAKNVSKEAIIVSLPKWYDGDLKPGDEVLVHHNIFRWYYNQAGRFTNSRAFVREDMFLVHPDELFAYKKDGDLRPFGEWNFVRPIKEGVHLLSGVPQHFTGEIVMSNVHPHGEVVFFTPHSEYEMEIGGETLYRMKNQDICIYFGKQWG